MVWVHGWLFPHGLESVQPLMAHLGSFSGTRG